MAGNKVADVAPTTSARRSLCRRRWFRLLLAIHLLFVGELAARLYWKFSEKVPPLATGKLIHRFYRESDRSGVETATLDRSGPTYDVLLLGGSVLHPDFGCIEQLLANRLASRQERPVRIFNLAGVGRTSRDSLLKYRRLSNQRFHLVVVCDGINDVRMNNVPDGRFRSDYTHCSWYLWIERLSRHPEVGWWALPYTLEYWAIDAADSLDIGIFVPRHRPRASWLAAGANVRTDQTIADHLNEMLQLASERGDRMVVCSFAWHIPADYSPASFKAGKLTYARHSMPIEMWGLPDNVAKALRMQNQAVRHLATSRPMTVFVDQEQRISRGAANFDDVCHLTPAGCRAFVANVVDELDLAERRTSLSSIR